MKIKKDKFKIMTFITSLIILIIVLGIGIFKITSLIQTYTASKTSSTVSKASLTPAASKNNNSSLHTVYDNYFPVEQLCWYQLLTTLHKLN